MDSGCSFHMCPKLEWFDNLKKASGSVFLGNETRCTIKGIGDVKLRMKDGSLKLLSGVRFIPEIKRNLISLGAMERKGYSFLSVDGIMKMMKGSQVVMQAKRIHSLYYLEAVVVLDEVNIAQEQDSDSWHLRLGHVSKDGVNRLIKDGIIKANSMMNTRECEVCIPDKNKKLVYPTGKHTSSSVLDYAHSDIWGPAQVASIGGYRYFLYIIDEYSRKIWLYVMGEKSDAFNRFRDWCKQVVVEK